MIKFIEKNEQKSCFDLFDGSFYLVTLPIANKMQFI